MLWWQIAALLVVATAAATWLLAVRARLAQSVEPRKLDPPAPTNLAELLAEVAAIRMEWAAEKKALDAYIEVLEDLTDTVERKRRRAAASASKVKEAEEAAPPAPVDLRQAAREKARALGIL